MRFILFALVLLPALSLGAAPAPVPAPALTRLRSQAPTFRIARGKATVAILLDKAMTGRTRASMQFLVAKPGMVIPIHRHPRSAELLYILQGGGRMMIEDAKGTPHFYTVTPGMAIWIPCGWRHSLSLKKTAGELKALQVYVPGGPEQRFRKGRRLR